MMPTEHNTEWMFSHIKYWLNHYGWNRRGWLGMRVS